MKTSSVVSYKKHNSLKFNSSPIKRRKSNRQSSQSTLNKFLETGSSQSSVVTVPSQHGQTTLDIFIKKQPEQVVVESAIGIYFRKWVVNSIEERENLIDGNNTISHNVVISFCNALNNVSDICAAHSCTLTKFSIDLNSLLNVDLSRPVEVFEITITTPQQLHDISQYIKLRQHLFILQIPNISIWDFTDILPFIAYCWTPCNEQTHQCELLIKATKTFTNNVSKEQIVKIFQKFECMKSPFIWVTQILYLLKNGSTVISCCGIHDSPYTLVKNFLDHTISLQQFLVLSAESDELKQWLYGFIIQETKGELLRLCYEYFCIADIFKTIPLKFQNPITKELSLINSIILPLNIVKPKHNLTGTSCSKQNQLDCMKSHKDKIKKIGLFSTVQPLKKCCFLEDMFPRIVNVVIHLIKQKKKEEALEVIKQQPIQPRDWKLLLENDPFTSQLIKKEPKQIQKNIFSLYS
ncbi:Uncharacterized protein QTN25_007246 [Entamoeba marina]